MLDVMTTCAVGDLCIGLGNQHLYRSTDLLHMEYTHDIDAGGQLCYKYVVSISRVIASAIVRRPRRFSWHS
jgi:hypothetical protein